MNAIWDTGRGADSQIVFARLSKGESGSLSTWPFQPTRCRLGTPLVRFTVRQSPILANHLRHQEQSPIGLSVHFIPSAQDHRLSRVQNRCCHLPEGQQRCQEKGDWHPWAIY